MVGLRFLAHAQAAIVINRGRGPCNARLRAMIPALTPWGSTVSSGAPTGPGRIDRTADGLCAPAGSAGVCGVCGVCVMRWVGYESHNLCRDYVEKPVSATGNLTGHAVQMTVLTRNPCPFRIFRMTPLRRLGCWPAQHCGRSTRQREHPGGSGSNCRKTRKIPGTRHRRPGSRE